MKRRLALLPLLAATTLPAADLPLVENVEPQPLVAATKRLVQALQYLGNPLSEAERTTLKSAYTADDPAAAIQKILDPRTITTVNINPESRVKVAQGAAKPALVERGWTTFLVKVHNEAGVTAKLESTSPNAQSMHNSPQDDLRDRWLDLASFDAQPLTKTLTGLLLEYRILSLYSRDRGQREAKLAFSVGQGTQDLGFRNETDILFTAAPAHRIVLDVRDDQGKPTTAAFEIRDQQGRVYPSQAKRTAPDFAFHPQVYRAHGEILTLPPNTYDIAVTRGPESIPVHQKVTVGPDTGKLSFKCQRWTDPSKLGWWSGDHHIHAAGCAHYTKPTEGVHATDMLRHILGEDLKVGANLTWGPCFDYQKQFFTGSDDKVSTYPYLLHYDIEVSGFGSHRSGHLCLLQLKEQIYPGGDSKDHWPTLCLNTLKWAKKQGALVGPAHSGWGLQVPTADLPNYIIPPYDGIGANEYIVDVTHMVEGPEGTPVPAVDFLSMVDTPSVWELNIWYHALNCGFKTRISGETDFPCIYGERVGLGRSYVKLDGRLTYNDWCEGIR
ncbi:MAG: CehA/McbA family metallohydrolase, partial [Verrucomicrobiales bacterium]|nr:CehA/McbA family metallohydrolase [Verrucomicrobiales bacterium]